MTGLLHEREFSRKSFLKGGGALIVGLGFAGAAGKASAAAGADPFASPGPPDPLQVDSWVAIHSDNTASIKTGRFELGQGTATGLLLIAGEELGMDLKQLQMVRHDTSVTPDTGLEAGSSSITRAGPAVRAAAASARLALLGLASTRLGVPAVSLSVKSGVVSGGGKSVTYGELIGDQVFNAPLVAPTLNPGQSPAKAVPAYQLVTTRVPTVHLPEKVTGTYVYVHNVRVPGMLHGRLVRPRGQGAHGDGINPQIVSVDEHSIAHIPGARVVRKGNFLGVVAAHEYAAIQAAAQLKVKWADPPTISGVGNLFKSMRDFDAAGKATAARNVDAGNVDRALSSAAHVATGTYKYHYQAHAVIGPTCAIGDVTAGGAIVYCNSQDAYVVRGRIATLLGLPVNRVRVIVYEGASCFGDSPCRWDAPVAAAVMSQLAGAPVRLQYMRWDENGWDNFGAAKLMDIRGGVDANGKIVGLDFTSFQIPWYQGEPTQVQVGQQTPGQLNFAADTFNSGSQYSVPNRRVTSKFLPLLNSYFKSFSLRAPGAPDTCFGSEQMIDELAHAAGVDPVLFRRQNISTADSGRWSGVLEAVAKLSGWQPRVAASSLGKGDVVTGRGIAMGGFANSMAAVVAEIEVNKKTGKILVKHLYAAQDAGLTVAPAQVENQIVGNLVQGASRALYEELRFDTKRVTGLDWVSYPIIRFKEHPNVSYTIVQRTDLLPSGSGEPPTAPTPAAIANAFFDATGVRLREAPMTPPRVRGALAAAGVI